MFPLTALLGRGEAPVDGVEDYCAQLSTAVGKLGTPLRISRVNWQELGWIPALRELNRSSKDWRGSWVLIQYTALAWSRRGFPFGALAVLAILRRGGARCAVMFHDPFRQSASGIAARVRGACQDWVVRRLYRRADMAIFADPLATIPWLAERDAISGAAQKAIFIPIGANIPERISDSARGPDSVPAVAVFCLSAPPILAEELADIAAASRAALDGGARFRLVFLGRGTTEAKDAIARSLDKIPVECSVLGLLPPDRISEILSQSSCLLCVRGQLYPRRGSAIAGIACGLPILGYAGLAENTPLAEAGLILVPYRDGPALGAALARLLSDGTLEQSLRQRSERAFTAHFSWGQIAARFQQALACGLGKLNGRTTQ